MRRLLAALAALLVTAVPAVGVESYERPVEEGVNSVRAHDVRWGPCVDRFAERRAQHLAERSRLVHMNLYRVARRCNGVMVGEVLARGVRDPRKVPELWMKSPAHHDVITNESYRRIGVGSVRRDGVVTTVAIFIRH